MRTLTPEAEDWFDTGTMYEAITITIIPETLLFLLIVYQLHHPIALNGHLTKQDGQ